MKILDDPALPRYIMDKIEENLPAMPKKGFVAGGSVAGWILERARSLHLSLNDIDLFVEQDGDTPVNGGSNPARCRNTEIVWDTSLRDSLGLQRDLGDTYSLVYTKREGILNTVGVAYEYGQEGTPEERAAMILGGFDLNCCQAGIMMDTGRLLMTEEFRRFAADYQLVVTSPVTPHHTVIRIASKAAALGCYIDYEKEYRFLAMIPAAAIFRIDDNTEYAKCFSAIHLPKYVRNRDRIDPWFTLANYTRCRKLGEKQENYHRRVAVTGLYQFVPKFPCQPPQELKEACLPVSALRNYYDAFYRPHHKGLTSKYRTVSKSSTLLPFLLQDTGYAKCDFHEKHLDSLSKFFKEHDRLPMVFGHLKLNIAQQLLFARTIRKSARRHGLFVYGIVENMQDRTARELGATLREAETTDGTIEKAAAQWLEDAVQQHRELNGKPLTDKLDIGGLELPHGTVIRELLTVLDLQEEGNYMHHCVGGYSHGLSHGSSAIFSIASPGERSTIQMHKPHHKGGRYSIAQHRGPSNGAPSEHHRQQAQALMDHLNKGRGWQEPPDEPDSELQPF